MRNRIILAVTIFLILGVMTNWGHGESIAWYDMPDLENKSDIIVLGTISFKEGNVVLITDQILKGSTPKELTIINYTTTKWLKADFVENEEVLLFLKSIDASSARLSEGYYSKWPRPAVNGYSDIIGGASIESIAALVNEILRIESKTDINERIGILRSWLDSSDSLLNLLALQYAFWGHIWPNDPQHDYQKGVDRLTTLRELSGYAFKLIQSDIPSIQAGSIWLLRFADPERALPILISRITDPNDRVREFTRNVLNTFATNLRVGGEFEYDSNSPPEELVPVQRKWQEWYDNTDFDE
jgi:hypothetical protein